MKEREYILSLYEIYKDLLSDRERDYFENYLEQNGSIYKK